MEFSHLYLNCQNYLCGKMLIVKIKIEDYKMAKK